MNAVWESEIIDSLSSSLNNCAVREYPEKPKDYFLKHPVGEVLVRYDGTSFSEMDITESYQDMEVRIELILAFKNLRNNTGLYSVMNEIRNVLFGKRLTNSTSGIQFEREDLIGEEKGVWEMGLKIKFNAVFVPTTTAANNPATNIGITLNSSHCDS